MKKFIAFSILAFSLQSFAQIVKPTPIPTPNTTQIQKELADFIKEQRKFNSDALAKQTKLEATVQRLEAKVNLLETSKLVLSNGEEFEKRFVNGFIELTNKGIPLYFKVGNVSSYQEAFQKCQAGNMYVARQSKINLMFSKIPDVQDLSFLLGATNSSSSDYGYYSDGEGSQIHYFGGIDARISYVTICQIGGA